MALIILWIVVVFSMIYYGANRVHQLFIQENKSKKYFYYQGFILIFYSTLIVGVTGFLSASITEYMVSNMRVSIIWVVIQATAELLRYLAPFVFAAIGVNMISHALTHKNT